MTNNETGNTQRKSPAWLIASVILNVFLVGLIVGSAPRFWFHGRPPMHYDEKYTRGGVDLRRGGGEFQFMYHAMQDLPPDMQDKFNSEIGSMRKELRPVVRGMHTNIEETVTAFTSDPIDTEALRQAFQKQNATRERLETVTQSAILDFIDGLSPEERSKLSAVVKDSWQKQQAMRAHKSGDWRKPNRPGGQPPDEFPGSPAPDGGPAPE